MDFAQRHAITDTCVLVRDIEASIAFYRDKLGFALEHRAPGFADFTGAGHTLALWERTHIAEHAGVTVDPNASASVVDRGQAAGRGGGRRRLCRTLRKRRAVRSPARRLSLERALRLFRRTGRRNLGTLRLA